MNKKLLTIPTSLLLTGALWPVVTSAAETDDFSSLDRNQDGRISLAEAGANVELADHFANLDTDGNGQLSKAELDGVRRQAREQQDQ